MDKCERCLELMRQGADLLVRGQRVIRDAAEPLPRDWRARALHMQDPAVIPDFLRDLAHWHGRFCEHAEAHAS